MKQDKHRTAKIRNLMGMVVSALFVIIGIAGFQRTQDPMLLVAFVIMAILSFGIISLVFRLVDRLLDALDRDQPR